MIMDGKFPPRGGAVVPAEDGSTGAATNSVLPNSNSTMVNVESTKELDESRKEVRHRERERDIERERRLDTLVQKFFRNLFSLGCYVAVKWKYPWVLSYFSSKTQPVWVIMELSGKIKG